MTRLWMMMGGSGSHRAGSSIRNFVVVAAAIAVTLLPHSLSAQEIRTDIYGNQAAATIPIAVPFPNLAAGISPEAIHAPFFSPLTRDLDFSQVFSIVPFPPNVPATAEGAKKTGASAFLRIDVTKEGDEYVLEARLYDVATGSQQLAKRYRGTSGALTRVAHMIASDLVRHFNGKPGMFTTQVAFVSTRTGTKEIWVMDYDGSSPRRITRHESISLTPDWSPDAEQLVYTSFAAKDASDLYIVNRRGGGRVKIRTGVSLNTAPRYSPDGKTIAFVGSVRGNPDIYLIGADGSNLRRLTTDASIESTPAWSPNGRQIAFTSGRSGTPQIYIMDAEGTNVRRLSFDGNWNDDATFSPDGEHIAYTSRVNGRFQIRILNLVTGESRILAGEGSNEQPGFSPDGRWILFTSNRTRSWQIYRIGIDGEGLVRLTTEGDNLTPRWSSAVTQ